MSCGRVALVLLALALVASAAHAASSPAHGSKGKKGKGSSCPNAAACGLATTAEVALLALYNTRTSDRFAAGYVVGAGNVCDVVDVSGSAPVDWEAFCDLSLVSPATLDVTIACPPVGTDVQAFGTVTEFACNAYVVDGNGDIINALPIFSSGTMGDEAICQVDISQLADGTKVVVSPVVACSFYSPLLNGGKTAGPKLSELLKKPFLG